MESREEFKERIGRMEFNDAAHELMTRLQYIEGLMGQCLDVLTFILDGDHDDLMDAMAEVLYGPGGDDGS